MGFTTNIPEGLGFRGLGPLDLPCPTLAGMRYPISLSRYPRRYICIQIYIYIIIIIIIITIIIIIVIIIIILIIRRRIIRIKIKIIIILTIRRIRIIRIKIKTIIIIIRAIIINILYESI